MNLELEGEEDDVVIADRREDTHTSCSEWLLCYAQLAAVFSTVVVRARDEAWAAASGGSSGLVERHHRHHHHRHDIHLRPGREAPDGDWLRALSATGVWEQKNCSSSV